VELWARLGEPIKLTGKIDKQKGAKPKRPSPAIVSLAVFLWPGQGHGVDQ